MKELKKAVKSLADDAGAERGAPDAGRGGGGAGALQGKAAARAKRADDYHARHPDWVAQFNALTNGECAGGPGGVKWATVRAWQQKHWQANNLFSDGLVGPKTLEAAKIIAKQAKAGGKDEAGKKDGPDEGKDPGAQQGAKTPADDEKQEPAAGNAEAAEAGADKPKLDESEAGAVDPADGEAKALQSSDDERIPPDIAKANEQQPRKTDKPNAGPKASVAEFNSLLDQIEVLIAEFGVARAAAAKKDAQAHKKEMKPQDGEAKAIPTDLPGGLMSAAASYKAATAEVVANWANMSGDDRVRKLLEAVNAELANLKVEKIHNWKPMNLSGSVGQFHPTTWTMGLDEKTYKNNQLGTAMRNEAVSTVFHEARHAEQRFAMARLLASQRKHTPTLAEEIASELKIAVPAAAHAIKTASANPIAGTEAEAAKGFYNDAVVHEKEHRSIEHLAGPIMQKGEDARVMFESLPDKGIVEDRWDKVAKEMREVWAAYDHLATEHDARETEAKLSGP